MRRLNSLNKIKDRYTQATKKDNFNKHQSDQAYAKISKPIRILLVEKQQLLKSREETIIVEDKA